MLRAADLLQKAKLAIASTPVQLLIDVSVLMLFIFWIVHVICCIWYTLGFDQESADTSMTWLSSGFYSTAGHGYEYVTALHWSITQITPGSMEVLPRSSRERIYNVIVLFFGLILGGSLIAMLSSMMTQARLKVEENARQFMLLQRYLTQKAVDPDLAIAIKMQVKRRITEQPRLKVQDVKFLSLLSTPMMERLNYEDCMKHLADHTFFNLWAHIDDGATYSFSNKSIECKDLTKDNALFEEGHRAGAMYILMHGQLRYFPGRGAIEICWPPDRQELVLKKSEWCSEVALWADWRHLGTMEATLTSETMCIKFDISLLQNLSVYKKAMESLVDYCHTFRKQINEHEMEMSDLAYGIDYWELISQLPRKTRLVLSNAVFNKMKGSRSRRGSASSDAIPFAYATNMRASIELLREEVNQGKCNVGLVGGELMRTVFVVALRIYQIDTLDAHDMIAKATMPDSRFLVKTGEVKSGLISIKPSCVLPGTKRQEQETSASALHRVIDTDLADIAGIVETNLSAKQTKTVEVKTSATHGVRTRYLRTTFQSFLSDAGEYPRHMEALPRISRLDLQSKQTEVSMLRFLRQKDPCRVAQQRAIDVLSQFSCALELGDGVDVARDRTFYMWLNDFEFSILSHQHAERIIGQWLAPLVHRGRQISPFDI